MHKALQLLGYHRCSSTNVESQKRGDEHVHGLMQALLGRHRVDDEGIGRDDGHIGKSKRQNQEGPPLSQSREAPQEEVGVGDVEGAAISILTHWLWP